MLLDLELLYKKYNMNIIGVIHIGAHFGAEYDIYKKLKINNIAFFEPHEESFNILNNRVGGECKLFNYALGNNFGKAEMYTEKNNNGQSNSLLKPKKHITQYPNIVFNDKVEVDVRPLDFFNLQESNDYNLINIDVQGFELEVFKGATNTLKNVDYIISEVNRDELYENCVRVEELDSFLKNFGFYRAETTWDGITWGDALYIKI